MTAFVVIAVVATVVVTALVLQRSRTGRRPGAHGGRSRRAHDIGYVAGGGYVASGSDGGGWGGFDGGGGGGGDGGGGGGC